ncbi:hypothetical protein TNIN_459081 [Trichonephila inaurata madagascariensis]|uniref:Uncharacterized protein n=1 Tax=Trichonephila inaurata madagascariensis TaxID=2747483 RepID=A0A8X6X5X0_9ARAC|nr:hypothetical protein TNIN_459081 [Trichonephila inaurata madagascariensis]
MLANDRRLSNWFRFSLACNDCFEDIIDEVFELVKDKAIKYKDFTSSRELQIYWTLRKTGDVRSFVSTVRPPSENIVRSNYTAEELAFMHSIKKRNRAGIEYFLNYLPRHRVENITEEHFSSLIDTIVYGGFLALPARLEEQRCDALYFLLSRLNGNVRDNILRQNAFLVLNNFLRYPFFGLFDKYATLLVSHLKEDNTLHLIRRIVVLQFRNEHLFGYELFKDFWSICPEEHKTYVKKECITYHFPGQGLVLSAIRDVEEATAT